MAPKCLQRDGTEGRDEFYVAFNRLGHIVVRRISVAKGPQTALHNAAHLYSNQANPIEDPEDQGRLEPANSRLRARHRNH